MKVFMSGQRKIVSVEARKVFERIELDIKIESKPLPMVQTDVATAAAFTVFWIAFFAVITCLSLQVCQTNKNKYVG